MTGVEELQRILAILESVIPEGPDPMHHRSQVLMGMAPGVLQRAAQLIGESKFDVATDLVIAGSAIVSEAYATFMEDRARAGKYSLEEELRRMRDGESISNTRIVRDDAPPNAIDPKELVELGVIDDESEVDDPHQKDACDLKFCGFVCHYPTCSHCDDETPSVVTFFGVELDGHSVIGNSLCEEHMKSLVDGLHASPQMHLVAQVLFVRGDDAEVAATDETIEDEGVAVP